MDIDAIGGVLGTGSGNDIAATTLGQEEFLQLFLTELDFQDPLEPLDNREFLAQIAQFTSLEQTRQSTESINNLAQLNATSQSISLLGRQVSVTSATGIVTGRVTAIEYSNDGTRLSIQNTSDGTALLNVRLSQITQITTDAQP